MDLNASSDTEETKCVQNTYGGLQPYKYEPAMIPESRKRPEGEILARGEFQQAKKKALIPLTTTYFAQWVSALSI